VSKIWRKSLMYTSEKLNKFLIQTHKEIHSWAHYSQNVEKQRIKQEAISKWMTCSKCWKLKTINQESSKITYGKWKQIKTFLDFKKLFINRTYKEYYGSLS
jgi:hypothetical protein